MAEAQKLLLEEAARPFAASPERRQLLVDLHKSYEQAIDEVNADNLIEAGFTDSQAGDLVRSFQVFIEERRGEITALQVLYEHPYRQRPTFADIQTLAAVLQLPPCSWTTDQLWEAYRRSDQSRVRGSGQRVLSDIVSLVQRAIGEAKELAPFADGVEERFRGWLAMQETAGRSFTAEQRQWLEAIKTTSPTVSASTWTTPPVRALQPAGRPDAGLRPVWRRIATATGRIDLGVGGVTSTAVCQLPSRCFLTPSRCIPIRTLIWSICDGRSTREVFQSGVP